MTRHLHETDREILIGRQPSLKDKCPRVGCGQRLEPSLCEASIIWECPEGHYRAVEVSGTTKLAHHEACLSQIRLRR